MAAMNKVRAEMVLQLCGSYSLADARAAYRAFARKYHPDMRANSGIDDATAEARIRDVNEAFDYIEDLFKSSGRERIECSPPESESGGSAPSASDGFTPADFANAVHVAERATRKQEQSARRAKEHAEAQESARCAEGESRRRAEEESTRRSARTKQGARRTKLIGIAIAVCVAFVVGLIAYRATEAPRPDSSKSGYESDSQNSAQTVAGEGGFGAFANMNSEPDSEASQEAESAVSTIAFSDLLGSYEDVFADRSQGRFTSFAIDSVKDNGDGTADVMAAWAWQFANGEEAFGAASGAATIDRIGPHVITTLNLYGTGDGGEKFQLRGSWTTSGEMEYSVLVGNSAPVRDRVMRRS